MQVPEGGSDIRGKCQLENMIGEALLSYKYATVNNSTPRTCLMNEGTTRSSFVIFTITLYDLILLARLIIKCFPLLRLAEKF